MNIVLYDGSFEGLLTAIFEIYEYKIIEPKIYKQDEASTSLFGSIHHVQTNIDKCERVFKKMQQKLK